MSNIQNKNHNLETFLKHLLTQQPLPQTATFTYSNTIQLVLQLIPNKGFVIGYNDSRVAKVDNPVMVWCDIAFKNGKTLTPDQMRDAIMLAKDLPTALDMSKKVIFEQSYFEMLQAMTQAIGQAKFIYAKNTKTLNGESNTQIRKI
jgi:hypothetical protein